MARLGAGQMCENGVSRPFRRRCDGTTTFTRMDVSTAERVGRSSAPRPIEHQARVADRVLAMLRVAGEDRRRVRRRPADPLPADGHPGRAGRAPTRRWSWRRCATTSARRSRCPTTRASPPRSCAPTCATRSTTVIRAHQDFQGRHYYAPLRRGPRGPRAVPGRAVVRPGRAVRRRVGPDQLRPRLPHRAARRTSSRWCARSSADPARSEAPRARSGGGRAPEPRRSAARAPAPRRRPGPPTTSTARYPDVKLGPVVALICAYEEERQHRRRAQGDARRGVTAWRSPRWWWWTAATTDRPRWRRSRRATCVLPVNLGHGVALRLGLRAGRRPRRPLRRHPRRRRPERPGRDPDHPPAPARRRGRLRDRLPAARGGRDDRPVPPGRGAGLRVRHQRRWPDHAHRHVQRLPGAADRRARRRRHQLVQDQYQTAELVIAASAGLADRRAPDRLAPRASGTSKKGGNLLFGLQYGRVMRDHLVAGAQDRPVLTDRPLTAAARSVSRPNRIRNAPSTLADRRTRERLSTWHADDGQRHPITAEDHSASRPAGRSSGLGAVTASTDRSARAVVEVLEQAGQLLGGAWTARRDPPPPVRAGGAMGGRRPGGCAGAGAGASPLGITEAEPPMPTGTTVAPVRAARKATPSWRSSITGPARRSPSGKRMSTSPASSTCWARRRASRSADSRWTGNAPTRGQDPGQQPVPPQAVLGHVVQLARGDLGGHERSR